MRKLTKAEKAKAHWSHRQQFKQCRAGTVWRAVPDSMPVYPLYSRLRFKDLKHHATVSQG